MLILVKVSEWKIAHVQPGWEDNILILKDREYECAK
jgi:hypothetical protein